MEDFKKDFVPYDRALKMKELGFNEPCFAFYNGKHLDLGVWDWEYPAGKKRRDIGECPQAPTFSQAFRWFREKYQKPHIWMMDELLDTGEYTYEEAELACLDKLIEIVESK